MKRFPRVLFLCFILSVCLVPPDLSAQKDMQIQRTTGPAPPFDLPLFSGEGNLSSFDVFPSHEYTFLIFWESGCPHCVESLLECETFYQEHLTDNMAVIGIHADQGEISEAYRIIEENGITFPQLWDLGGEAGQSYNISYASFTLYLVDRRGKIVAFQPDPQGDIKKILDGMLSAQMEGAPEREDRETAVYRDAESAPGRTLSGFVFRGNQRLRYLGIDAYGRTAAGPYGESVQPGNTFLYRFDLEMSRKINRHLRVGGLLRISNEGKKVLEAGPDYLGSEWGSAFAEITAAKLSLRLGYYDISMTPLTLMRWDWENNPRIGGNAGCGCGAAAGVLLVESLEELGPKLTVEGGIAVYRTPHFETRIFYAIPRRAKETSSFAVSYLNADPAKYSLDTYGAESIWRRFDSRTGLFWKAGVRLVGNRENRRSVDFLSLGYAVPDPWYESTIITADGFVPIYKSVGLRGEWIVWNDAKIHGMGVIGKPEPIEMDGGGGFGGIMFKRDPGWKIFCDYIRLDSGFYSSFAALSYEPNREGFRFSAEAPLLGETAALSLFYRRLQEIDAYYTDAEKEKDSFFGASIDLELSNGFGGSFGWLDDGSWRGGEIHRFDETRRAFIVSTRYRLSKNGSIEIQYQRIDGSLVQEDIDDESLSNLYSVYITTLF